MHFGDLENQYGFMEYFGFEIFGVWKTMLLP